MVRIGDEGVAAEAGLEKGRVGGENLEENLAETGNWVGSFISDFVRRSAEKPHPELGLPRT